MPDVVLDALASIGLAGDGRLMALSSYENRVYQIHLEASVGKAAAAGDVVVAKFYRPDRWTDAQILEEHSFANELMAAEVPVVGALELHSHTLHHFNGFAFSVSPSRGGRRPELENFEVLQWIGRFLARIHTVGSGKAFVHRPALDLHTFGYASREVLLSKNYLPLDMESRWLKAFELAMQTATAVFKSVGDIKHIRLHGDLPKLSPAMKLRNLSGVRNIWNSSEPQVEDSRFPTPLRPRLRHRTPPLGPRLAPPGGANLKRMKMLGDPASPFWSPPFWRRFPMFIETTRLKLIPATPAMARAEIAGTPEFARLLSASVPRNWPPSGVEDALPLFLDWLEAAPDAVGWYSWYALDSDLLCIIELLTT